MTDKLTVREAIDIYYTAGWSGRHGFPPTYAEWVAFDPTSDKVASVETGFRTLLATLNALAPDPPSEADRAYAAICGEAP